MKTEKENLTNLIGRLAYETPRITVLQIEMEQGIAAGSTDPSAKQQWDETETQSHDVSNNYWD